MNKFEHKPGRFSLFKNDRREKDSHPQYKGDGKLPDGTDVWVSAWVEEGKNGKYFSCSMQPKDDVQQAGVAQARQVLDELPEDDIPF